MSGALTKPGKALAVPGTGHPVFEPLVGAIRLKRIGKPRENATACIVMISCKKLIAEACLLLGFRGFIYKMPAGTMRPQQAFGPPQWKKAAGPSAYY